MLAQADGYRAHRRFGRRFAVCATALQIEFVIVSNWRGPVCTNSTV